MKTITVLIAFTALIGSSQAEVVSVNNPRPLAFAGMMIQKRFAVPINYEDTFYVGSTDAQTFSGRVRLIPAHRRITFSIEQSTVRIVGKDPVAYAAAVASVTSAVAAFNRMRGAELFRVLPGSGDITVQAVAYVDAHDHFQPLNPLLDRPVTLVVKDLHWETALGRVLMQLKTSRHEVGFGTVTLAGLRPAAATQKVTINATNRPAREVISQILHSQTMKPAWRLLCGPSPDTMCVLNVNTVDESPTAVDIPVY